MVPTELLIAGTGGPAKEAAQPAKRINSRAELWHSVAYVTDDPTEPGRRLLRGCIDYLDAAVLSRLKQADLIIGAKLPRLRRRLAKQFARNPRLSPPNQVHPSLEIDDAVVSIGRGNLITQGVAINCDVRLSDFTLLNWNYTIGHAVEMGSYNVINPGAGTVVTRSIETLGTYVGMPLRRLES